MRVGKTCNFRIAVMAIETNTSAEAMLEVGTAALLWVELMALAHGQRASGMFPLPPSRHQQGVHSRDVDSVRGLTPCAWRTDGYVSESADRLPRPRPSTAEAALVPCESSGRRQETVSVGSPLGKWQSQAQCSWKRVRNGSARSAIPLEAHKQNITQPSNMCDQ